MRPFIRSLIARRVSAYVVDCSLLFLILGPIGYAVREAVGFVPATGPDLWFVLVLNFSLPSWTYFILADRSKQGATVGKHLVGIAVRKVSGGPLQTRTAAGRTAVKLLPWELTHGAAFAGSHAIGDLSAIQYIGVGIAYVMVLLYLGLAVVSGGRASLHDILLRTEVQLTDRQRLAPSS